MASVAAKSHPIVHVVTDAITTFYMPIRLSARFRCQREELEEDPAGQPMDPDLKFRVRLQ